MLKRLIPRLVVIAALQSLPLGCDQALAFDPPASPQYGMFQVALDIKPDVTARCPGLVVNPPVEAFLQAEVSHFKGSREAKRVEAEVDKDKSQIKAMNDEQFCKAVRERFGVGGQIYPWLYVVDALKYGTVASKATPARIDSADLDIKSNFYVGKKVRIDDVHCFRANDGSINGAFLCRARSMRPVDARETMIYFLTVYGTDVLDETARKELAARCGIENQETDECKRSIVFTPVMFFLRDKDPIAYAKDIEVVN